MVVLGRDLVPHPMFSRLKRTQKAACGIRAHQGRRKMNVPAKRPCLRFVGGRHDDPLSFPFGGKPGDGTDSLPHDFWIVRRKAGQTEMIPTEARCAAPW